MICSPWLGHHQPFRRRNCPYVYSFLIDTRIDTFTFCYTPWKFGVGLCIKPWSYSVTMSVLFTSTKCPQVATTVRHSWTLLKFTTQQPIHGRVALPLHRCGLATRPLCATNTSLPTPSSANNAPPSSRKSANEAPWLVLALQVVQTYCPVRTI